MILNARSTWVNPCDEMIPLISECINASETSSEMGKSDTSHTCSIFISTDHKPPYTI